MCTPLRFEPIYQYRLWGGRRLADLLTAPLPGDGPIGEAWVLSDRDDHPSHVADGPLLNLEHNNIDTQRVNRASLQENGVAWFRSEPCEVLGLVGALIGVGFESILKGKASAAGKIAARGRLGVDNPTRPSMDAGPPRK